MLFHMIARFGDWYDGLAHWDQAGVFLSLILVTMAIVFLAIQLFAYIMLRSLRREIREAPVRDEPWHLETRASVRYDREYESYCRTCRTYKVTAQTACEHCGTPLLLFPDALAMAAHMAQTFPLPPRRDQQPVFVAHRGGRTH